MNHRGLGAMGSRPCGIRVSFSNSAVRFLVNGPRLPVNSYRQGGILRLPGAIRSLIGRKHLPIGAKRSPI
jgi:hypothetical protein